MRFVEESNNCKNPFEKFSRLRTELNRFLVSIPFVSNRVLTLTTGVWKRNSRRFVKSITRSALDVWFTELISL